MNTTDFPPRDDSDWTLWLREIERPGHSMSIGADSIEDALEQAKKFTVWETIGIVAKNVKEPEDTDDACVACDEKFVAGDLVYDDIENGGSMHAACVGTDRESFANADGTPLAEGDPIPKPYRWAPDQSTGSFQSRVAPWMQITFGAEVSADVLERGDRHLEEVLELLQATHYPPERVAALTTYVYSRPIGEPAQEVGGVMVTLAAFCLSIFVDMHRAAEVELARVWTKVDKIRAKQASKPHGSALPIAAPSEPLLSQALTDVIKERRRQVAVEGWTYEHDDQHDNGELSMAAATYAVNGAMETYGGVKPPWTWPFSRNWWKPKNPRSDLVRAAALIIADIERMDRAADEISRNG